MKKNAFTLAEVLITLAIIGVVAAMTIPTLMTNVNAQQFTTGGKKANSVLKQAIALNLATDGWDFGSLQKSTTTGATKTFSNFVQNRFNNAKNVSTAYQAEAGVANKTYAPGKVKCDDGMIRGTGNYTADKIAADTTGVTGAKRNACVGKAVNTEVPGVLGVDAVTLDNKFYEYQLEDGMVIGVYKDAEKCSSASNTAYAAKNCVLFVDVNGLQGPNLVNGDIKSKSEVVDIFPFYVDGTEIRPMYDGIANLLNGSL